MTNPFEELEKSKKSDLTMIFFEKYVKLLEENNKELTNNVFDLRRENESLSNENEKLTSTNEKLFTENEKFRKENRFLTGENMALRSRVGKFEKTMCFDTSSGDKPKGVNNETDNSKNNNITDNTDTDVKINVEEDVTSNTNDTKNSEDFNNCIECKRKIYKGNLVIEKYFNEIIDDEIIIAMPCPLCKDKISLYARVAHLDNGFEKERAEVNRTFDMGDVCEVTDVSIGRCSSKVMLKWFKDDSGFPCRGIFNTVFFDFFVSNDKVDGENFKSTYPVDITKIKCKQDYL